MAFELFKGEANFIKELITHPCARPWFIYADTFLPAFLKLMITVVLFDVEDAIRAHGESIVRDKGGKGGKRHSPRIKAQGSPRKIDRWAQKGLKVLLVVTEPLERIGFTWLLFSAVDEFFYDWQTLLAESGFCETSDASGPLTRSRGPGVIGLLVGGSVVPLPDLRQNRAGWSNSSIGAALPFGRYTAVLALTVKPLGAGIDNVFIRIVTPGALGPDESRSDTIALVKGEQGDMVVRHVFFHPLVGGGTIRWEIAGETVPAGIEAVKGHMTVFRRTL